MRIRSFHLTGNNRGDLVRLAVDGSASTPIVTGIGIVNSASWADDDTIVYSNQGAIYRVPAIGGTPELIVPRPADDIGQDAPQLLPDGDSLLFSRKRLDESWDDAEVVLRSLSSEEETILLKGGSDARYVETGHLTYANGDRLFGVGFDLETGTMHGSQYEVMRGLTRALALSSANYGVARDGTLAYLSRLGEPVRTLVWVDREGNEYEIPMRSGNYWYAQLSPDDSMVALNGWTGRNRRIWIHEFERGTRQLTFGNRQATAAIWSPDGRVFFAGNGTAWQNADGSGVQEGLGQNDGTGTVPYTFTPDGGTLLRGNTDPPRSTWAVSVADSEVQSPPILTSPSGSSYNASISPNGKWVTYQSDETGELEVYVQPFPDVDAGGKWKISPAGGVMPLWSRDAQNLELFFLEPSAENPGSFRVMQVSVNSDSESAFEYDSPRALFERRVRANFSMFRSPYDISRDGTRFLMLRDAPQQDAITSTSEIVIVQNWLEELKQQVPTD